MLLFLLTFACQSEPEPPSSVPVKVVQPAPDPVEEGFRAHFETTEGAFVIEVMPSWAPLGAERFRELVETGFFDDVRFFRVISGFMVQFGIHGTPEISGEWKNKTIKDDPVKKSNTRGMVSFATSGRNSRTTQIFINFSDNSNLDGMGFAPFGKVISGMEVVDALYSGYGEGAPQGRGPWQNRIQDEGNTYLDSDFPEMDRLIKAVLVED